MEFYQAMEVVIYKVPICNILEPHITYCVTEVIQDLHLMIS